MRMCAAPVRYKTIMKRNPETQEYEIGVAEDHSVDPLAPIELDVPMPQTERRAQLYSTVFAELSRLEFMRRWNGERNLSEHLERRLNELEEGK